MSLINSLKDDNLSHTIGAKARNLAIISKDGNINTPHSWVINSEVFIQEMQQYGYSYCADGYELADCQRIYMFLSNSYPKQLYAHLWDEVSHLVKNAPVSTRFAVRSSHNLEDGNNYSFAGQFYTELNLSNVTNIVHSIFSCWMNTFAPGVISYATLCNITKLRPCSIILQEMIPSRCSGVLFRTKNGVLVHANWGLCKHIVDGHKGFDTWIQSKNNPHWICNVGDKNTAIVPVYQRLNPDINQALTAVDLPHREKLEIVRFDNKSTILEVYLSETLRTQSCLSEQQISDISRLASIAASYIGLSEYDVEWCITPNGDIYILQIRPLSKAVEFNTHNHHDLSINQLQGIRIVGGSAAGYGHKVFTEKDAKAFPHGGILIAKSLIGPVLHAAQKAAGCIIQAHSVISHSAIIARELGLPTVGAMDIDNLEEGRFYCINGAEGTVEISNSPSTSANNNMIVSCTNYQQEIIAEPDLRPILSTAQYYNEIPDDIIWIVKELGKSRSTISCVGFENCEDDETRKIWEGIIDLLPSSSIIAFSSNSGNIVTYAQNKHKCIFISS